MKHAAVVLLVWGTWTGVADSVQAIFSPAPLQYGMLACASAATLLAGLVLWALDAHRRSSADAPRLLADSSFATVTVIAGLTLAMLGAGFGLWLILIGAGFTALGAGGLVREGLARRGAGRRARPRPQAARPTRSGGGTA